LTSDISWIRGYGNVLAPMERASALFRKHLLAPGVPASDPRYRRALFHLLACETSCYRYWGQGIWTDYGAELARRACQLGDLTAGATRTEGESRRLRRRRVASCGEVLAGCTLRSSSAGQRQDLWPARRAGAWSGAVVPGAQPVPGVADLGADVGQARRELSGVLVAVQGHGAWRRSYRDPDRAAAVPGDLAS
jgi:hypothetical protein